MGGSEVFSWFYTPPSPEGGEDFSTFVTLRSPMGGVKSFPAFTHHRPPRWERTESYNDLCNTIPTTCAFLTYFASYKRIDIPTLSCYNKAKKGGADMIENVWIDKSIASAKH